MGAAMPESVPVRGLFETHLTVSDLSRAVTLYAMTLSGARLLDVGDVVLKVPLDQADLRQDKRRLTFGGMTFHVMALSVSMPTACTTTSAGQARRVSPSR
jgi:hypothetical protein